MIESHQQSLNGSQRFHTENKLCFYTLSSVWHCKCSCVYLHDKSWTVVLGGTGTFYGNLFGHSEKHLLVFEKAKPFCCSNPGFTYSTAQMQRHTRSTIHCLLHAQTRHLPSQVGKLATLKSLYTWFTTKLL